MENAEYLSNYEKRLKEQLLRQAYSNGLLSSQILETPDISGLWDTIAPSYLADNVKEIASYPMVSLGWAIYTGLAVGTFWDEDWETYSKIENLYEHIRDKRGYDYMDEEVRESVMGLKGDEYDKMENDVQSFAETTLAMIRHEQIEPQSPMAFYIYVISVKVLYILGAALALHRKGYNMVPA